MTNLWRGKTLTDRGRLREKHSDDEGSETAADAEESSDGGKERSGQTSLAEW